MSILIKLTLGSIALAVISAAPYYAGRRRVPSPLKCTDDEPQLVGAIVALCAIALVAVLVVIWCLPP